MVNISYSMYGNTYTMYDNSRLQVIGLQDTLVLVFVQVRVGVVVFYVVSFVCERKCGGHMVIFFSTYCNQSKVS